MAHSNAKVCQAIYKKVNGAAESYKCAICQKVIVQKKNTGYTNLMHHVQGSHKDYQNVVAIALEKNKIPFAGTDSSRNMYEWVKWIVHDHLEFTFVESEHVRRNTNLKPICVNTLKKYFEMITLRVKSAVKERIKDELIFGVVIDGWSDGMSNHYLGVFFQCKLGSYLLGHRKLVDNTNQTALNNYNTISIILEEYGKHIGEVSYIVTDNTNVNPALANLMLVPLIGCASHKFNLAVKRYLREKNHEPLIEKINDLCIELRHNNKAGLSHEITN